MELLRLFVAIDLPIELKQIISQVQERLAQKSKGIKWVKMVNLHLTLKFLGETPLERKNEIIKAVKETAQGVPSFPLQLTGLGTFGLLDKPKVMWIGIEGQKDKLIHLHSKLDNKLADLGFARENRKYSPHLTLGRIKEGALLTGLHQELSQLREEGFGDWQVSSLKLMQSILSPAGPVYKILDSTDLGTLPGGLKIQ